MRFFAELKKAYASIEGGGVWIYDNFYLIKRSYSDICASKKAIRRFLEEKDSDRLLSLLDGFLFKYDFRSPQDKLLAYLRGQRYVYSSQFLSLVPVLLRALALRELGRICGNMGEGLPYSKSHLSNALGAVYALEAGAAARDGRGGLCVLRRADRRALPQRALRLRAGEKRQRVPRAAAAAQGLRLAGRLRLPPQPRAGAVRLRAGRRVAAAVGRRAVRPADGVGAAFAAGAGRLRLHGVRRRVRPLCAHAARPALPHELCQREKLHAHRRHHPADRRGRRAVRAAGALPHRQPRAEPVFRRPRRPAGRQKRASGIRRARDRAGEGENRRAECKIRRRLLPVSARARRKPRR